MSPKPTPETRARKRRLERHGAAMVRALSHRPDAELRAGHLRVGDRPVAMATPYVAIDIGEAPIAESRGVADALGALLRFSDPELHRSLSPTDALAHIVFDILEQLRCESLVPDSMQGVKANLDASFDAWDARARAGGLVEGAVGVLVYTVTQIVRGRLVRGLSNHMVEEVIEATWFNLAPQVGHATSQLKPNREDQAAYAVHALEVGRIISDIAAGEAESFVRALQTPGRDQLLIPPDWDDVERDNDAGPDGFDRSSTVDDAAEDLLHLGDYRIYTTEYDCEVTGDSLYPEPVRINARNELDRLVKAQSVSVPRLAKRLRDLFAVAEPEGWTFGEEQGTIDGRRLSQLVANPSHHRVFRRERDVPVNPVAVSFLVDTSGSMKAQRYDAVAVFVDTFCRALDLAGASTEVLGFTTSTWTGGRARQDWDNAGRPDQPGRLNEAQHIVYKGGDESWRRSRRSVASMMRTPHYREGLDGEALAWAYGRLTRRPEARKVLIMISDGSPMDTATSGANRPWFLDDHLASVADRIEHGGRVELGAIGIALDMSTYFANSISLDLTGTLTLSSYDALHRLFAR